MYASSFDSEANQHNHGNGTGKDHCAKNDMRLRLICNLLPVIACVIAEHEEEAAPQDSARIGVEGKFPVTEGARSGHNRAHVPHAGNEI